MHVNMFIQMYGDLFSISIDGFKYFVTFIDDISKVTWVYILNQKMKFLVISRIFT